MGDTLSNLWGGITTGAGNAWDWLTGPSAAQQAMQAGRWNDPSLAQADRATALGQAAVDIARGSQQGLGPGAVLGTLGASLGSAGIQPSLQRSQIGEALARAGLLQQQTAESQAMLPYRQQLMGAQTGLLGAQTTSETQMLGPRIAELASQTGLNQAQAWSLYAKTPAEIRQILAATGVDEAKIQATIQEIAKTRYFNTAMGIPDPTANMPLPGSNLFKGGTGDYNTDLGTSESGGNYAQPPNPGGYAGKYQVGAPLLSDLGVYKMGDNEQWAGGGSPRIKSTGQWTGQFNINGFPDVHTLDDFLKSPGAQDRVQQLNVAHSNNLIDNNGLDKFIGQTVAGVPVTREGMLAAIHLAGPGGLINWLQSGGRTDVADANGTRVSDYMRRFAGTSSGTRPSSATAATNTSPTAAVNDVTARDAAASDASRRAVGDLSPAQQALVGGPRTAAAVPPPVRSTGNPNLDALLAGVRLAQTGPRSVGAPGSTFAGPSAPTGPTNLTPAQQALLSPVSPNLFGPRPAPVNFGTSAPTPAFMPSVGNVGGPSSIPIRSTPATTVPSGLNVGIAPGMILPGDQVLSGQPLYGIQPDDDLATIVQKARANGVYIDNPNQAAALRHPPVTLIRTGDGTNGFSPGERVQIQYDPMTGKVESKQISAGQPLTYVTDQRDKLQDDFEKRVNVNTYDRAKSQIEGAFAALQEDRQLHPDAEAATPATQLQLIHAWWQLMNPGAIVRQGSIQAVMEDPRTPEIMQRYLNKLSTAGQLTGEEQAEVLRNLEAIAGSNQKTYNREVDRSRANAKALNIPENMWDTIATKDTDPTRYTAWNKTNPYQPDQPRGTGPPAGSSTPTPVPGYGGPPIAATPGLNITGSANATPAAPATPAVPAAKADIYSGWTSKTFADWVRANPTAYNNLPPDMKKGFTGAWDAARTREQQ